jgi:hypothetical protein
LGRVRRLTDEQFEELSLYCWTLQQRNPTGLLWGRARELWGGARLAAAGREQRARRRPQRRVKG